MGIPIGEDERAPEEDLSGLYDGYLAEFKIEPKPDWKIESEISRWGKDPDKVDHSQYAWVFKIDDPTWQGPESMTTWTGRTWGMKSKANLFASTLLNAPIRAGMDSDELLGKRCRIVVDYSEKGRNYVSDIKAPKKTGPIGVRATAPAASDPEDAGYWERVAAQDPGPDEEDA